ncbi:hypothetical protein CDV36_002860 [Fusarium kuroshium]|uniref:Calcineurin-like phosphoesterase domain-containing protein n=1 Tax=Fusarium kuroshium TaxID=2010991 RepID=A0A3M2SIR9_9HYPO|nr:hypothetical protein CDV36_002860 [Fusarium kuroshium]
MQPLTSITLPGRRQREAASKLRAIHNPRTKLSQPSNPLRVVCISDTHNTRPILPRGDLLIHAGDLTENGSFEEVQAGLKWLSDQPHRYKVLIAGNHDVLLDEAFLTKYPERRYGQHKTKADLDWGSVIYLEDSCVTLDFPSTSSIEGTSQNPRPRKLTIFGSPWTPRYGTSAFQYLPDDEFHWSTRFSSLDTKPDIIITHGPPKHHLDARDFHRAGCPYLAEEIAQIRPRLVVFGHIHVCYGREDVVLDSVQRAYEEVMTGWAGWMTVSWMAMLVLWAKLKRLVLPNRVQEATVFVNASVVSGPKNELTNEPIVVEL